jgi:hypothetical protein
MQVSPDRILLIPIRFLMQWNWYQPGSERNLFLSPIVIMMRTIRLLSDCV